MQGIYALHHNDELFTDKNIRSQGELGRAIKYLEKNVSKEN